jgi:hypothetical protein
MARTGKPCDVCQEPYGHQVRPGVVLCVLHTPLPPPIMVDLDESDAGRKKRAEARV